MTYFLATWKCITCTVTKLYSKCKNNSEFSPNVCSRQWGQLELALCYVIPHEITILDLLKIPLLNEIPLHQRWSQKFNKILLILSTEKEVFSLSCQCDIYLLYSIQYSGYGYNLPRCYVLNMASYMIFSFYMHACSGYTQRLQSP